MARSQDSVDPGSTSTSVIRQRAPRKRSFWSRAQRVLFVSGLVLVGVYGAARLDSYLASRAALRKFADEKTAVTTAAAHSGDVKPSPAKPRNVDFTLWDRQRIWAYKQSISNPEDAPLGVLTISTIHLQVPILNGTDDLTLNRAVGLIAGTTRPGDISGGNVGIAGHRDGFFRGLKDVRAGDVIEVETTAGTDTYIVDRTQIVSPDDVSVLRPRTVPSLTLVTCYPFYVVGSAPQRYVVTASLAGEIQGESANAQAEPLSQNSSTKGERQ